MMLTIPERRRSPRVVLGSKSWFAMPTASRVDLVDVSLSGMAFTSSHGMEIGRIASVRTTLGREAFHGDIRICWSRPRGGKSAKGNAVFETGAVFVALEDSCRRVLETFLKQPRLS